MQYERKIVLLVDDDNEFLSELQEALALSGYIPIAVSNGREAMKAARKIRPDVILLDLKLGNENGFAVAARIRKDPVTTNIPVIMMSGSFNPLDHSNLLVPSAANIYLNKPFSQKDVVRGIQTALTDKTEAPFDLMKHLLLDA